MTKREFFTWCFQAAFQHADCDPDEIDDELLDQIALFAEAAWKRLPGDPDAMAPPISPTQDPLHPAFDRSHLDGIDGPA